MILNVQIKLIFSNQSAGTCDLEVQLLQDPGHAALPPQVDAQGDLHQPSHASYQQLSQLCHILPSGGKVSVLYRTLLPIWVGTLPLPSDPCLPFSEQEKLETSPTFKFFFCRALHEFTLK